MSNSNLLKSSTSDDIPKDGSPTIFYHLRILVRSFLVALPLMLVFLILYLLLNFVLDLLAPVSAIIRPENPSSHWYISIVLLVLVLACLYFFGLFIRKGKGLNRFRKFEDKYFSSLPMYISIRDLLKKFVGMEDVPFEQAILVDPFGNGAYMVGFITEKISENVYAVFVPTAPNPTNGFIFYLSTSEMTLIDASSEEVLKTVVGMGTGSTCLFEKENAKNEKIICNNF